ncbi:MAG: hypothetical protein KBT75_06615 [Oleispira antarctica]|nr:hypothetical protein [Oleispira antarctica]MBQ0793108.1 hypothetical protein [Oleispira antarctica]
MTDQTFNFPIYYKKTLLTDAMTESLALTRYAVLDGKPDKEHVAMSTDAGMVFIEQGVTNWTIDNTSKTGLKAFDTNTKHVCVNAEWLDSTDALKKNIHVVSGSSGNVFGSMGALLVPDDFKIPTLMATPENVKYYGLKLIEAGEVLTVHSEEVDIIMMEYDYTKIYKKDFLMKKHGGGGIFLEHHNFPHIHIPMEESCGGYIVIGKQIDKDEYHFTAFQIPYGYALYTPANTIHGDGTLVGKHGLALADSNMISANTVLIYNKHSNTMAKNVVPDWEA